MSAYIYLNIKLRYQAEVGLIPLFLNVFRRGRSNIPRIFTLF